MTLPELWRANGERTLARPVTFELNRRAASPAWGLALAFLGASLVRRGLGRSRRGIIGCWLAVSATMFAVWYVAIVPLHIAIDAWLVPWLVVLAVLLCACALWRLPADA